MLNCRRLEKLSIHITKLKVLVFCLVWMPFFILLIEFYQDSLGIDPLDRLTQMTGEAALILFLLSFSITPFRQIMVLLMIKVRANYGKRLSDWNWVIKLRRIISIMSFVYAAMHFAVYYWLDQGADFTSFIYDITERYFITVGLIAFILFIPLVATSTNKMMKLLGKNWKRLHRSVYLIAILVILHYWMLTKVGVYNYLPYALIVGFILLWKYWYQWVICKNKIIDDGMEAVDREQISRIISNLDLLAVKQFGVDEGKTITAMLFHIFSSESHFSESILNRQDDVVEEISLGSKSLARRLKVARNNANKKLSIQSMAGVQALHRLDFLERVHKVDALLKHGIMSEKVGDKEEVNKVWNEIFSTLMPIHKV